MSTDFNFGEVRIVNQSAKISLGSKDFESSFECSSEFIRSAKCIINGEATSLDSFIKTKIYNEIITFLKKKVTIFLKEGEYDGNLIFEIDLAGKTMLLDEKKIEKINVAVEFKYQYKISLTDALKEKIVVYENRLIAFLDILGFSRALENADLKVLFANYSQLIDTVNRKVFQIGNPSGSLNFEKARFLFDSIVLVSKPVDQILNVTNFLNGCSSLLEEAFKQKLPLRGAINYGDFIDSTDDSVFLSSAFSALVKEEKTQNWAGCVIMSDAESIILKELEGHENLCDYKNQSKASVLLKYNVPLKDAKSKEYLCVNFINFLSDEEINLGLEYLKGDVEKHINTLNFVNFFDKLFDESIVYRNLFIKILKTRAGFRCQLVDKNGNEVKPIQTIKIPVEVVHGEERMVLEIIFQGERD